MDLGECCNQRAPSPVFKPIMEPLPVGNQFVVISLCFGILTLRLESEERGSWKRCFYHSVFCNDRGGWHLCSRACNTRALTEIRVLRGQTNMFNTFLCRLVVEKLCFVLLNDSYNLFFLFLLLVDDLNRLLRNITLTNSNNNNKNSVRVENWLQLFLKAALLLLPVHVIGSSMRLGGSH